MTILTRFEAARHLLTQLVRDEGQFIESCREWDAVPFEPYDSLAELTAGWANRDKPFLISSLHSDRTIYTEPSANWYFRLWHDTLHVHYQKDITFEDELWLSDQHCNAAHKLGRDAEVLMHIDTAGQSVFCKRTGAFPEDQITWAFGRFVTLLG